MSDKQKKGIFYDAAQTVEDMRKLISWFRIEDCRTDMVRFGNEFAHPLGADALSMDTSAGIAARTNITAPETFPQLREEVQNGSKRAFDQANLDHPEWEEFGWWEEYDDIPGCPEERMRQRDRFPPSWSFPQELCSSTISGCSLTQL